MLMNVKDFQRFAKMQSLQNGALKSKVQEKFNKLDSSDVRLLAIDDILDGLGTGQIDKRQLARDLGVIGAVLFTALSSLLPALGFL